jgi:hypothetical protein
MAKFGTCERADPAAEYPANCTPKHCPSSRNKTCKWRPSASAEAT